MRESAREKELRLKLEASQARLRRHQWSQDERSAEILRLRAALAQYESGATKQAAERLSRGAKPARDESASTGYVHVPEWHASTTPPPRYYATYRAAGEGEAASPSPARPDAVADLLEALADVLRQG